MIVVVALLRVNGAIKEILKTITQILIALLTKTVTPQYARAMTVPLVSV